MTVTDVHRLYDCGYWANGRLLPVISELTAAEFTQAVAGSNGSIRDTLVHVMSAEWGWLSRCGGPDRGPALKPSDYPTLESLVETWGTVEGHVRSGSEAEQPPRPFAEISSSCAVDDSSYAEDDSSSATGRASSRMGDRSCPSLRRERLDVVQHAGRRHVGTRSRPCHDERLLAVASGGEGEQVARAAQRAERGVTR